MLSPLEGRGLPVPHEQARERFTADWGGPFYTSIGRFTDQASQIYIRGGGSSNYMLHTNGQLRIVTPTDPTMPFIGVMNLFDKNISSGGILGLELTGDRSRVDRAGRPIHFDAATSVELNSGIFTNSDFTGTVDIRYRADGTAAVKVRGRVYTIGTTNPLIRSS